MRSTSRDFVSGSPKSRIAGAEGSPALAERTSAPIDMYVVDELWAPASGAASCSEGGACLLTSDSRTPSYRGRPRRICSNEITNEMGSTPAIC